MADILDVAKYILEKCGAMTTMKLQKLCYYSQAWSLAWDEVPIFNEDFQAWANGPVCYELFKFHKGQFEISVDNMPQIKGKSNLDNREIEVIDKVLDYYGNKEAHWLSELTHKERPWRETRQLAGAMPGDACNEVIPKELIRDYYAGL